MHQGKWQLPSHMALTVNGFGQSHVSSDKCRACAKALDCQ